MPTVLVADDDPDILRLLTQRLHHRGWVVVGVTDGHQAIAALLEAPPDIAILDGRMPGLAGHEVCARLRADERTASVPVIMLTANAAEIDHRVAMGAGADAYMVKPFRIDDLDAKLRELLDT